MNVSDFLGAMTRGLPTLRVLFLFKNKLKAETSFSHFVSCSVGLPLGRLVTVSIHHRCKLHNNVT